MTKEALTIFARFLEARREFREATDSDNRTAYRWSDWRDHRDDFLADYCPPDLREEVESLIDDWGETGNNAMQYITVCLLGDDREREYPVMYNGSADFPKWERADGSAVVGTVRVALVSIGEDREALIAEHPDYGWCSVGAESCRDFEPEIDEARLESAS